MRPFGYIFLGLFVYGLFTGMHGAGLIALAMVAVVAVAARVFRVQEDRWYNDPASATTPPSVDEEIERQCCECSGDRL